MHRLTTSSSSILRRTCVIKRLVITVIMHRVADQGRVLMTNLGDRESEIHMIITKGKGEVKEMGWKVSEWTYLKRWLTDIRTSWVLEGGSWHPGNLLSIGTTTLLQHWLVVKQGVMCLICCAGVLVRIRTTRLQTATALGWPLTTTPLNPTVNRGFVFSTCQQKQC